MIVALAAELMRAFWFDTVRGDVGVAFVLFYIHLIKLLLSFVTECSCKTATNETQKSKNMKILSISLNQKANSRSKSQQLYQNKQMKYNLKIGKTRIINLFCTSYNFINILLLPMRKRTTESQSSHRPEEELRFLSMTEDIDEGYYQQEKRNCKYDIEPWKNQNQNPSESPERRPYAVRPTPSSIKSQKPLQIKFIRASGKILEPNSCNSSFRVKPALSKRNSLATQSKLQSQNKPEPRGSKTRRQSKRKISEREPIGSRQQNDDDYSTYHSPVNLTVYPIVTENKRKRLFRKMDKFQNFVSVSLRK